MRITTSRADEPRWFPTLKSARESEAREQRKYALPGYITSTKMKSDSRRPGRTRTGSKPESDIGNRHGSREEYYLWLQLLPPLEVQQAWRILEIGISPIGFQNVKDFFPIFFVSWRCVFSCIFSLTSHHTSQLLALKKKKKKKKKIIYNYINFFFFFFFCVIWNV